MKELSISDSQNTSLFLAKIRSGISSHLGILSFSIIFFIFSLGDAIISYASPIQLENSLGNSIYMGIILGSSSIFGILADIFIGEWFRGKKYSFFAFWMFIIAFCFPLLLLFAPKTVIFFVLAMAVWGIYYELIQFSNFHYINQYTQRQNYTFAWSLLSTMKSLGYTLGPVIAGFLITRDINDTFFATLGLYLLSFFAMLLFFRTQRKPHHKKSVEELPTKRSILHEIKVWGILGKRIWPLLLFLLLLILVDSAFWSIGTVLSEEFKSAGMPGELFITIYTVPTLFVGLVTTQIAQKMGKKRGLFWAGLLSAIPLMLIGLNISFWFLLGLIFISGIFDAIAYPLLNATYADYIERLGDRGNDIIALQNSVTNISYIFGPIISGLLAELVGFRNTFVIMGIVLFIVSVISLIITPRKIKMPQTELSNV